MRILVFSQYFWPENFRINDIVKFLSKNDKIYVLTSFPSYPNKKFFKNFNSKKKIKYLNLIRIPVLKRSDTKFSILLNYISFTFLSFFYLFYFFLFKKIDRIFIFGTSPPSTLISGVLFNLFKQTKIIYWILDLWPDTLRDLGLIKSKTIFNISNKFLIKFYNKCDLILCQSKTITNIIKKRSTTKTKYFPSWCEDEYLIKKKNKIKPKKNLQIFFSGNIGKAQDLITVVKAINILKNEKIIWNFIGTGSEIYNIKNYIKILNLKNKVKFYGKISSKRASKLLRDADILLVTLANRKIFSYTIPGKLQNYLGLGKPIVGMINGEAKNIINKNNLGLASKASDFKSLANNIIKIKKMDIKKRKSISANCLNYVKKNFLKKNLMTKLRDEYIEYV
ncbi:glycosyltransferase family 4 protein [Candidatus Pelagibacter sp.]|nr:glycosyltransferase family 4 protein [Candidatus Pelagibacter sp.]